MAMADEQPHAGTREGPVQLPSDTWDFDPDQDLPDDPYRGARRAGGSRRRRPLLISLGILVVTAIAVTWISTAGGSDRQVPAFWGDPSTDDAGQSTGADPSATVEPSISVHTMVGVTPTPGASFTPLVYEAEGGMPEVKLRGAQIVAQNGASGGKAVRITSNGGEIQLRGITVPSDGAYRFTIYYAQGEAARTGQLAVGNATHLSLSFGPGSGCCTSVAVDATLQQGSYSATLTMSTVDSAVPAIDRIVVSRP
jgi:hypothetical protein